MFLKRYLFVIKGMGALIKNKLGKQAESCQRKSTKALRQCFHYLEGLRESRGLQCPQT